MEGMPSQGPGPMPSTRHAGDLVRRSVDLDKEKLHGISEASKNIKYTDKQPSPLAKYRDRRQIRAGEVPAEHRPGRANKALNDFKNELQQLYQQGDDLGYVSRDIRHKFLHQVKSLVDSAKRYHEQAVEGYEWWKLDISRKNKRQRNEGERELKALVTKVEEMGEGLKHRRLLHEEFGSFKGAYELLVQQGSNLDCLPELKLKFEEHVQSFHDEAERTYAQAVKDYEETWVLGRDRSDPCLQQLQALTTRAKEMGEGLERRRLLHERLVSCKEAYGLLVEMARNLDCLSEAQKSKIETWVRSMVAGVESIHDQAVEDYEKTWVLDRDKQVRAKKDLTIRLILAIHEKSGLKHRRFLHEKLGSFKGACESLVQEGKDPACLPPGLWPKLESCIRRIGEAAEREYNLAVDDCEKCGYSFKVMDRALQELETLGTELEEIRKDLASWRLIREAPSKFEEALNAVNEDDKPLVNKLLKIATDLATQFYNNRLGYIHIKGADHNKKGFSDACNWIQQTPDEMMQACDTQIKKIITWIGGDGRQQFRLWCTSRILEEQGEHKHDNVEAIVKKQAEYAEELVEVTEKHDEATQGLSQYEKLRKAREYVVKYDTLWREVTTIRDNMPETGRGKPLIEEVFGDDDFSRALWEQLWA